MTRQEHSIYKTFSLPVARPFSVGHSASGRLDGNRNMAFFVISSCSHIDENEVRRFAAFPRQFDIHRTQREGQFLTKEIGRFRGLLRLKISMYSIGFDLLSQ